MSALALLPALTGGPATIERTLSHYKVLEEIGRGGMGIVYKALDLRLNREVALKVLPPDLVLERGRKQRFVQEAKAAAAIKHPNIAVVYDIDEEEDETFIAMELIEGDTLSDMVKRGRLPLSRALDIAMGVAAGLTKAHDKGIVHRDLKPSNIMLTREGHAKIIDFGLSTRVKPVSARGSKAPTVTKVTHAGQVLGTFNYMSPEQARGQEIDCRSDVFSFGIVLHEMVTGKPAFKRATDADTLSAILSEPAPRLSVSTTSNYTAEEIQTLQSVLDKCLAKDPADRFPSAEELSRELSTAAQRLAPAPRVQNPLAALLKEPRLVVPLLLVLSVALGSIGLTAIHTLRSRWARLVAIPEIMRLVEQDDYTTAYPLAERVEHYLPDDPILDGLWPQIAVRTSIHTEPPGAEVFFKEYSTRQSDWKPLGRTPVESVRLPRGVLRWRIEKEGFESIERSGSGFNGTIRLTLSEGSLPPNMVRVPTASIRFLLTGFFTSERVSVPAYLIDRHEITNREFREFIDGGGYRKQDYWNDFKFVNKGAELSWEEALALFRDRTGRPGPSTWEGGTFPEGQDNYPVRGVSWYEAAAYAEFRQKSLPTIYHWSRAAIRTFPGEVTAQPGEGPSDSAFRAELVALSNFSGDGLAPVGSYQGVGPYGTYDMAGNVREWAWNAAGDSWGSDRYVLGGAWSDRSYLYTYGVARSPWDRSETNGFRCVRRLGEERLAVSLRRPVELPARERIVPVSDVTFQVYKDLYAYDRTDLNDRLESADEGSEHWRRETITFDASYGNERVIAHLFLPQNVDPPYQTVAYFPHSGAISQRSSDALQIGQIDFIIKSGRAVLYPVLNGTYERHIGLDTTWPSHTRTYAAHVVQWINDFRRSMDYLETRSDIDLDRLGYHGFSWGGWMGPVVLALDNRFKAGVFVSGGIPPVLGRPEASSASFASHVRVPVLMISGRHDILRPVETFQKPMFDSLGTAEENKRHAILDGGHSPPRNQLIRETLEWLDRYLGPVQ